MNNIQSDFVDVYVFSKRIMNEFKRYNAKTQRYHNGFDFLDNNKDNLKYLIEKDKQEFIDILKMQRVWEILIAQNYQKFKLLCADYNIDSASIVNDLIFVKGFGCDVLNGHKNLTPEIMITFCNDIDIKSPEIDNSIIFKNVDANYNNHLLYTVLNLIKNEKLLEAGILLHTFSHKADLMFEIVFEEKPASIYSNELWKNYINKYFKNDMKDINIENIGSQLQMAQLNQKLNNDLVQKSHNNRLKI